MNNNISDFHIPLFGYKKQDYYEFIGSAILLEIDSIYIFVTANHVIDATKHESYKLDHLFFPTQPSISVFQNKITGFEHPFIDIAFGVLDYESIQKLEGYCPAKLEEVVRNINIKEEDSLYFIGYPGTWNKQKRNKYKTGNPKKPKLMDFESKLVPDTIYKELGVDREHYIICSYDKKKKYNTEDGLRSLPNPHGISGGGIWYEDRITGKVSLVGINLRYEESKKLVIGIRIHWLIKLIREAKNKGYIFNNLKKNALQIIGSRD